MRAIDADALRQSMINYFYDADVEISKAIVKGINLLIDQAPTVIEIPQSATNGEVIKTLFPNETFDDVVDQWDDTIEISMGDMVFDIEFWNAPYKAGE